MSITQMSVFAKKRVRVISEGQLLIYRSADMRRMLSSLYTFIFRLIPLYSNFKAFLITSLQFHFYYQNNINNRIVSKTFRTLQTWYDNTR